eukprot:10079686-Lingulodinium_polyedra.AAC.1
MCSEIHAIVAALRISRYTHSMRRPPRGGRCMECANCELRGAAAVSCISDCISEQFSRESCSDMLSETSCIVVAPRMSR